MKKRTMLIGMISILMMFSLVSCGLSDTMADMDLKNVGNIFMTALRDGEHATSWSMLGDDVKTEIGSEAEWTKFAEIRNFSMWKFNETIIENDTGLIDGEATLGADTYSLRMIFKKIDDEWKVYGLSFAYMD